MLQRLLREIQQQETGGLATYSVVIADNDPAQSARPVVEKCGREGNIAITYAVEGERNIALARNTALSHARGDFIAFIDDDEFPAKDWLLNLIRTYRMRNVSGVLGPVVPRYEVEPPRWVRAGGFYERPRLITGSELDWPACRTGNVLFAREILADLKEAFRKEFGTGGEDQDFFRRLMEKGHRFIWCDEAVVYEVVPKSRWGRGFLVRRAMLRGRNSARHPKNRLRNLSKSVVAVPVYSLALPVLFIIGHHYFMKSLVKLADHIGRLLACVGFNVVRERPM
jgi:succinoglycan biosynthesis protein ExoM